MTSCVFISTCMQATAKHLLIRKSHRKIPSLAQFLKAHEFKNKQTNHSKTTDQKTQPKQQQNKKCLKTCPDGLLRGQTRVCCLVHLGWFIRSWILPSSGAREINPVCKREQIPALDTALRMRLGCACESGSSTVQLLLQARRLKINGKRWTVV